ncbi:hypothetical protein I4U23_009749 [Adineta vaga]|nr:hypothetical protein I4U23_009749 [Adineta vaga]
MANTNTSKKLHRRKIDIDGNYLPYSGYTIVAHAIHPLPKPLVELVNYLFSSEIRNYYSFLPSTSYHVTINPLENVCDQYKSLLVAEQQKLKAQNTSFICTVKRLIRSRVILIEVDFPDDDNHTFEMIIKNVRSNELRQVDILHEYTLSWHLTLAYQYKDIENDMMESKLDQIIKNIPQSAAMRFKIPLDHIRICHYNDMTKFTPI